jgi:hypothetical protein
VGSGYTIRALDESSWEAFAGLVEANNGVFGGCWCMGHEATLIDEFAWVDPETGERTPEVQKIVSFGLASDLDTLLDARGVATGGAPLADYLGG